MKVPKKNNPESKRYMVSLNCCEVSCLNKFASASLRSGASVGMVSPIPRKSSERQISTTRSGFDIVILGVNAQNKSILM
jgi:hypothetical protein